MSLFEKISGAKQALALLAKIDFADIQRAIALVNDIQDKKSPLSKDVTSAIELAQLVAKYTDTKTDDQVLAALNAMSKTEGFQALVLLVGDMLESGGAVPVGALPDEGFQIGQGTDKQFIPVPVALQIAQIIVSIILYLRKDRSK